VPILLASTLTASIAIAPAAHASEPTQKRGGSKLHAATRAVTATVAAARTAVVGSAAPSTYRVQAGDTVSSVAGRFGVPTASVLALNGLGWKSLIFPGQVLKINKAATSSSTSTASSGKTHTIASGDTVGAIAARYGVGVDAVLSANGLSRSSIIYPGQKLDIPSASATIDATPASSTKKSSSSHSGATSYTIAAGDSISSIAAKFGVSTSAVLSANGMSASSLIYPGTKLTIPTLSVYIDGQGMVTLLDAEMRSNAKTIISVGRSVGVSDRGIVIALATAMQESALANLNYGHLDSVGLFQQRPSQGWGSRSQLLNPTYAARLFFGGPTGPNSSETPGLLDIRGWNSMSLTQAAQAVQISAYPNAYAQWETSAKYWLSELG
jgi:LysM repeat protein